MTLQEWMRKGGALLRGGPHAERARRDAELLLLHAAGLDRASLLSRWKENLDTEQAASFVELIERRLVGEPIQYILGEAEFYGLPFRVTPDVLIPRPETEHVVEKALAVAAGMKQPRIVDVGAGSGAIVVALAYALPDARITAIDVSEPALAIAKENAARNGVDGRIRFLRGDLLEPIRDEVEGRFDVVVSNPPYVPSGDAASLAVEVRDYEPALALFAGEDGMEVYRRLIPEAFGVLKPGAFIVLEIGFGQADAVRALLDLSGFRKINFMPDLQGIPRVACGQRP